MPGEATVSAGVTKHLVKVAAHHRQIVSETAKDKRIPLWYSVHRESASGSHGREFRSKLWSSPQLLDHSILCITRTCPSQACQWFRCSVCGRCDRSFARVALYLTRSLALKLGELVIINMIMMHSGSVRDAIFAVRGTYGETVMPSLDLWYY